MSKENDPSLWNMLTNENAENYDLQTDSDDDYDTKENTKNNCAKIEGSKFAHYECA